MKTGIITFHAAINYGSVLQAFALQEYLTARGHDVSVIDFRSKAQRQLYPSAISFSSRDNAKRTLSRIMRPFSGWKEIRMTATKHSAFSSFLERYLHQTPEKFFAEEDLRRYDWSSYGMLVSGSDQIWNLSAIDASPAYFLDFVSGMKKIAYAPSAGPHPVSSGRAGLGLSQARKFISDYSAVSVREKATADFYSLGDAPVLPDPTVLHEADFYRSAECPLSGISLPERYVLYYAPGRRSKAAEMLADAASAGMLGKKAAAVLPQRQGFLSCRLGMAHPAYIQSFLYLCHVALTDSCILWTRPPVLWGHHIILWCSQCFSARISGVQMLPRTAVRSSCFLQQACRRTIHSSLSVIRR